jgi:hypothetical protein
LQRAERGFFAVELALELYATLSQLAKARLQSLDAC